MPRPQRQPAPSRNTTNTAGDFTGRERDRLMQEHADEVAEAQQRQGLITASDQVVEEKGIFDPRDQGVVGSTDNPDAPPVELEEIVFERDDEIIEAGAPQTNPLDRMRDLQEPTTQQKPSVQPINEWEIAEERPVDRAKVVLNPLVIFRVNSDIEDMTFGRKLTQGPDGEQIIGELQTMSFYRGRRYKAPREIYDHLESKGLIYH